MIGKNGMNAFHELANWAMQCNVKTEHRKMHTKKDKKEAGSTRECIGKERFANNGSEYWNEMKQKPKRRAKNKNVMWGTQRIPVYVMHEQYAMCASACLSL